MSIIGQKRHQAVRQLHRARQRQPRSAQRLAAGAARALGLGQDDAAADHRRAGIADCGLCALSTTKTSPASNARDRNVGFVFQHYALFRHMTVFENVAFGLRVRKQPKKLSHASGCASCCTSCGSKDWRSAIRRSSRAASGSGWHWPGRWPFGRRCCCSTSRSARSTPRCGRSCAWLRRLHEEIHVTSVFVTHDQEEAFEVADRWS